MGSKLLHRFRAERLLREEFEALRTGVLARVAARLSAAGVRLDADDLDACYAAAWHGLYAAMLDGQKIDEPAAWLTLVTHRRAIDEHRARRRLEYAPLGDSSERDEAASEPAARALAAAALAAGERRDLATELDDRARLRELLEALRTRLSAREREAATLCYLHGLSRVQAAAQMGISAPRMRKLMDGRGSSRPGVSAKLGALVETIEDGRWCEEQGSLMRGFAFGILDPQGERYRLAQAHHTACSSCRAYILSLRGLAAVLPPVPAMLHAVLGAGAGAAAGASASAGTGASVGSGAGAASGSAGAAVPAGGAALSASGAGAAGGGWWLLGGPAGAKLAVGCLLALGVGCVAIEDRSHRARVRTHARHARVTTPRHGARASALASSRRQPPASGAVTATRALASAQQASALSAAARASREFGPEQRGSASSKAPGVAPTATPSAVARAASAAPARARETTVRDATTASDAASSSSAGVPAAQREFAPG